MNLEPDITPDDTQPTGDLSVFDTQPVATVAPARKRLDLWLLVLGGVIVLTAISLVITVLSLLLPSESGVAPLPTPTPRVVEILVGGEYREVATYMQTVGELLDELQLTVGEDDALSHSYDALLQDGMIITIDRARDVTLIIDGEAATMRTPLINPNDILMSLNIRVDDNDIIMVDGTRAKAADLIVWPIPVTEIDIHRAYQVRIVDEGQETSIITTARIVGDAMFEAGYTLYVSDNVVPGLTEPVIDNMTIQVTRAQPITIEADDFIFETRVQSTTVEAALIESGVMLNGLDYVIPEGSAPIEPGMAIQVVRVTENAITEREIINYEAVYQPDENMELDTRALVQVGQSGAIEVTTQVRYENGEEVNRTQVSSVVVAEARDEIIAYGTQIVIRTVDTPEGPREYWRVLPNMLTTSYKPEALGGDDITALGMKLTKGIVAANPKIIPYRTEVYVPGYGIGLMADTGGPRSTPYWIDLGYDDESWKSWLRYDTSVYMLTPVPDKINYLLPAR